MTLPANLMPIRVRILDAVAGRLKQITPANGYYNDLSQDDQGRDRVVRGRLMIGNDEPLPFITVIEPPLGVDPLNTRRQADNSARVTEWDVLVQGWAEDDETPGDQAYLLSAEVCKLLAIEKKLARPGRGGTNFFGLGKTVFEFSVGSPIVRPSEFSSSQSIFYVMLTFKISEDMADPFRDLTALG